MYNITEALFIAATGISSPFFSQLFSSQNSIFSRLSGEAQYKFNNSIYALEFKKK